jgi:hypothetical protein
VVSIDVANKGDLQFFTVTKKIKKSLAWNFCADKFICPP